MITIKNRNLNICGSDKNLGFFGDNLRKRVDFLIADKVTEDAIFRLYLTFDDDTVNFLTLSEVSHDENGLYLVWNVDEEHIYKSGTVIAQIKAFEGNNVIWHSTSDTFVVGSSPEESRYLQRQNAEFTQIEKSLNELHKAVEFERTMLPYVGDNGNWFIYDVNTKAYVDSGKPSAYEIENPDIADGAIENIHLSEDFKLSSDHIEDGAVRSEKIDGESFYQLSSMENDANPDFFAYQTDDENTPKVIRIPSRLVKQFMLADQNFVYLGMLPDISRLDKQLLLKGCDTTKTYRFDFGNDIHIDDNVIPSGSYVGNVVTTDELGLILQFASLVFDGVKRTIVLDTGIPNAYDYFEENVFAVEDDFINAGNFRTVAELKEYPFEENKLYSLFIPSDSELSASLNSGNYSYWTATYLVDKADVPDGTIRYLLLTNKYNGREFRVALHSGEITSLNVLPEVDQTFDPETTPQSTNAISGKAAAEMLESVGEQWGKELDNKASVNIEDQGNYFVSETVEGALQELGAEVAGVSELLAQI